ncbi:MAG TPA: HAD-IA family hydrolase [Vicinamibacterales bacterium]
MTGSTPRASRTLVAFDLDGTLVDSRRDLAESASQLVVERGGRPLSQEAVVGMVGEGAALLVQRALLAAHLPPATEALDRFLEIYDARLLNHTVMYPGMLAAVGAARAVGRVAVLTNKPLHHTWRLLDGLGIRDLFADVVGGDGEHPRKPNAQGLRALMNTAGAEPATTLMVGDSLVDLETATNSGAACCLVSWGFGFGRIPRETLSADQWIADDAAGLASVIERFARVVA